MKAAILVALLAIAGCASKPPSVVPASYLTKSLGSNMDSSDHVRANEVLESGSEGRPVSWVNPISQKRFTVTPLKTFKKGEKDCRTYSAVFGGRAISGTACRLENGIWLS